MNYLSIDTTLGTCEAYIFPEKLFKTFKGCDLEVWGYLEEFAGDLVTFIHGNNHSIYIEFAVGKVTSNQDGTKDATLTFHLENLRTKATLNLTRGVHIPNTYKELKAELSETCKFLVDNHVRV